LARTQMTALKQIQNLKTYQLSNHMILDPTTRRNLELNRTYRDNNFEGSLLWVLDHCCTPMGGRMLRDWLVHPLVNQGDIEQRLDAVTELIRSENLRSDLREQLDGIRDVERLSARVAT